MNALNDLAMGGGVLRKPVQTTKLENNAPLVIRPNQEKRLKSWS